VKNPELVDILVAQRIRALRKERGMSQSHLAKKLGLTFQQIQKYERGINRIGAGRLFELSRIFGVPIQAMYPRSEDTDSAAGRFSDARKASEFLLSADGWRLCRAFLSISDPKLRNKIVALVQDLAEK